MASALYPSFYPVKSRRGRLVHATAAWGSAPCRTMKTVCDRPMRGWVMATAELNCRNCQLAVGWDCRPPKRRKKKKKLARRRR